MLKRLGHSVREFKKYAWISPVLVAIETFIETFIPYLMSKMIDNGIIPGNLGYIEKLGGFMLIGTFFLWLVELGQIGILVKLAPDLPKTCDMTCITIFKIFHLKMWITSPLQVL